MQTYCSQQFIFCHFCWLYYNFTSVYLHWIFFVLEKTTHKWYIKILTSVCLLVQPLYKSNSPLLSLCLVFSYMLFVLVMLRYSVAIGLHMDICCSVTYTRSRFMQMYRWCAISTWTWTFVQVQHRKFCFLFHARWSLFLYM